MRETRSGNQERIRAEKDKGVGFLEWHCFVGGKWIAGTYTEDTISTWHFTRGYELLAASIFLRLYLLPFLLGNARAIDNVKVLIRPCAALSRERENILGACARERERKRVYSQKWEMIYWVNEHEQYVTLNNFERFTILLRVFFSLLSSILAT